MTETVYLNDAVCINLSKLIDTRLLIQSNSGGGKSWLIRRILEQSHGKVQQLILDLEGEFSTLREKYDYVLAGKEGDTPATPKSAALLARRLLELNVSAIIDLYELSHQERKQFVRLFLNAMVNAPKSLWHPCLVIIDEAHVFAPQTGQSEAMEAVIDLATRGRKRGYCAVLATQRISKLHKDAVAECLPGTEKILTREGYRPISEIKIGDYVLSHTGNYRMVLNVLARDYHGELLEIKAKGSNIPTLVTPEHPLLVTRRKLTWQGNKISSRSFENGNWVKAKDLSTRDYIIFPRPKKTIDIKSLNLPFKWEHKLRNGKSEIRHRSIDTKLIDDLLIVVGYYLSEGSIHKVHNRGNSYKIEFSFGKSEQELTFVTELGNCLANLGLKASIYKKAECYTVQCSSAALAIWLQKNCGKLAYAKKIPTFIKQLPSKKLGVLLKAYMNGDGYRPKTGEEIGRTVSEQLAVDLRDVALKIGKTCSLYRYKPNSSTNKGQFKNLRDFYVVQVTKRNAKSGGSILNSSEHLYLKINSIKRVDYSGIVYNLEVEKDNSFCTVNQTLHNCNNKLIGRTGLDIDRKRAAEELGFTTKEDALALRNLPPGNFFAFGPAISEVVTRIEVGEVSTSHPKAGDRIITHATPPTANIKALLGKLADLPQEAIEEAHTIEDLRRDNAALRREVSLLNKTSKPHVVVETVINPAHAEALKRIMTIAKGVIDAPPRDINRRPSTEPKRVDASSASIKSSIVQAQGSNGDSNTEHKKITGGALRMLQVLASRYPMIFSKSQLATLTSMSPRSGTYGTYLSLLKSQQLIYIDHEGIQLSEGGKEYMKDAIGSTPHTQDEIINMWRNKLTGGARRIFDVMVENYPDAIHKEELGMVTNMIPSSGTFGTYLSLLRRNGLIETNGSLVAASKNLFI